MGRKICLLFLLAPAISHASDLGRLGDVYDIREQDFLVVIKDKLTSYIQAHGEKALQEELEKRVTDHAMRPEPVQGLVRGSETRVRTFDPSFTVARDIADTHGNVFAHKGQKVSAFDVMPVFNETLYFLNADDPDQMSWMLQQKPTTPISKIILVNGNIKESAEKLKQHVYFDQAGTLVKKFGIRQVPAVIFQEPGKPLLRITEVGLP